MFNGGLIIGPAIGAAVYALTGPGWCFTINGISFIAVIIALVMMRIEQPPTPTIAVPRWLRSPRVFRYVRGNRLVLTLIAQRFYRQYHRFWPNHPAAGLGGDHVLNGDVTTNGLLHVGARHRRGDRRAGDRRHRQPRRAGKVVGSQQPDPAHLDDRFCPDARSVRFLCS